MEQKKCQNCGKERYYRSSVIKKGGGKFCSKKCFDIYQTGKINPKKIRIGWKHTDETKLKMSISNKGKKRSKETKEKLSKAHIGLTSGMLGKHHSDKTRKRLSITHRGRLSYKWQGGITKINKRIHHSIEWKLWRESVFKRDNFICQKYNIKGIKLHPHHIKNFAEYPELRFAIDNGITLSEKAHNEFHSKYGRKNNTKEQLLDFINN